MKDLRRLVATLVIGSFTLAALMGIAALLGAGELGETEGRILATTVVVGIESIAVLCYLALAGRPSAWLGAVGAAVSAVAFVVSLDIIWADGEGYRLWGASSVVAATFAQASLLVALTARRGREWLLATTLVAVGVVGAMVVAPILNESFPEGDGYWRVLGVVAILDVLGSLVLIALAVFVRAAAVPRTGAASAQVDLRVDAAVRDRLVALAAQRGATPSEIIAEALLHQ